MTDKDLKISIQSSIKAMGGREFSKSVLSLFATLGYKTDRQNPFMQKTFQFFKDSFLGPNPSFNEDKALIRDWSSVDLLFQLSKEELTDQKGLFEIKRVDNTIIETYLFFAIELSKTDYTRTALAQITREINKVFPMPVMVVFRHGNNITLSVINRRLHKRDEQKDVLEKVTLIKDISIQNPHRAHIEILFDLSFEELKRVHKFTNFVELHNAWQKTLDTKELNKRFYRELSNWYFWAIHEVTFPGALMETDKLREHNAKNLIRLLTRILFVWFVKEKNLIPDQLFDERYIRDHLINGFEPRKRTDSDQKSQGSKYYRAILQNLFFASLNQTVGKREFRKNGQQMNVTNLMRYESYFKDAKAFLKLLENVVPFMNGGLFECLDAPDPVLRGRQGGDVIVYEDGFSDRKDNILSVPDYIFFGAGEHADLSEELGDKKQKDVAVSGLINILKSYKFTVTENTPIEEDIALDPELLGRVFENLLASYNPETKTTARKQTGSFYTPREIVNYMVDESIKAYLKQKLETEAGMTHEDAEAGLVLLLGYNEAEHLFDYKQTAVLINAIDTCKILDPACGSGAFPMGILHKLVHILHKLDPQNSQWKERQIAKARAIEDISIRDQVIEDIETAFNNNELDYGRKLYLIENCIYGVDIQPIATQISKLRFFISLIVDQKSDKKRENFGIRPLPNLETKFVAANTLIGIEKPHDQPILFDAKVQDMERELRAIRHRLFSAKTPATKRKLREADQCLRERMGKLLRDSGWPTEAAGQLAGWDPYDQNASSPFFDAEWMFGITDGFDVVIGNPPYDVTSDTIYRHKFAESIFGRANLYSLFIHKSIESLLQTGGHLTFINPKTMLSDAYFVNIRKFMTKHGKYKSIIKISDRHNIFENVLQAIIVYTYQKSADNATTLIRELKTREDLVLINNFTSVSTHHIHLPARFDYSLLVSDKPATYSLFDKMIRTTIAFSDARILFKTGAIQWDMFKDRLSACPNPGSIRLIWAENIQRYRFSSSKNRRGKEYINADASITTNISNKTIVTQRTTADEQQWRIIATIFDPKVEGYTALSENHTNFLQIVDSDFEIEFILSLINSKLFDCIFRHTNGNTQVSSGKLNSLPIKPISLTAQRPFVNLVKEILAATHDDDYLLNTSRQSYVKQLEHEIDLLAYQLYDLTPNEISMVENSNYGSA